MAMCCKMMGGLLLGLAFFGLADCGQSAVTPTKQVAATALTVESKPLTTELYYSGVIQPLTNTVVLSPLDARVAHIFFQYGQWVQKNQPLIAINSEQLADDYRKAITDFLQKKETYVNGKAALNGMKELHDAGVMSDQDYLSKLDQYDTDTLSFYQSKYELEQVLRKARIDPTAIEQLTLKDTLRVNQLLQQQHFNHIQIQAPVMGIALFPTKEKSDNSDSDAVGLQIGDELKQNQNILSIGDLSGFTVNLQVSEIDIRRIHPGISAAITGAAFPSVTLQGRVTQVATQAAPNQGERGALSLFNVVVQAPQVTPAQRRAIAVGMTAKVTLTITEQPSIRIPLTAVSQNAQGDSVVTVVDSKKQQRAVVVTTGDTTLDSVVIVKGLKPGDQIMVPPAAPAAVNGVGGENGAD